MIGGNQPSAIGGINSSDIGGNHQSAIGGNHPSAIGGNHPSENGGIQPSENGRNHPSAIGGLLLPGKVYFKNGSAAVALRELTEIYGLKRALVVTGAASYAGGAAGPAGMSSPACPSSLTSPSSPAGLTNQTGQAKLTGPSNQTGQAKLTGMFSLMKYLEGLGMRTAEYFTIGDPVTVSDLRSALPKLREFRPEVIVGLGRSNALSAAKLLRLLCEHPGLDPADSAALLKAACGQRGTPEAQPAGAGTSGTQPGRAAAGAPPVYLVLIPQGFADGAQNTPFAELAAGSVAELSEGSAADPAGQAASKTGPAQHGACNPEEEQAVPALRVLKGLRLIPDISVTDAQYLENCGPEIVRRDAGRLLGRSLNAYLDRNCCEYTAGLLKEAICSVLQAHSAAAAGDPAALERLHNASSVAGNAFGNVFESYDPAAVTLLPAEASLDAGFAERLAALAAELGYPGPAELLRACALE